MAKDLAKNKYAEFKSWYQSKTIIGLIISSISGVVFALTSGKIDIQGAAGEILNADEAVSSIDNVVSGVTFFIGQVVALWGRLKAKTGIKVN